MDVKIQYTLATFAQIEETFSRFFPEEIFGPSVSESTFQDLIPRSSYVAPTRRTRQRLRPNRSYSISELNELARKFAELVPEYRYSIAQLQGYLLTKKLDPVAAVDALPDWLRAQDEEKAKVEELRQKRRLEAAKRRKEAKELDKMLNSDADSNVKERRESQEDPNPDPAEPITPPSEQTENDA
jgi:mitochondrial chaperone BCS1